MGVVRNKAYLIQACESVYLLPTEQGFCIAQGLLVKECVYMIERDYAKLTACQ